MPGGPRRTDSAFSDVFLGPALMTFRNLILECEISENTHGGKSQNSMQCYSHPAGRHSSDTSFMVLGENRDLWASPENISVLGRNFLTAMFGGGSDMVCFGFFTGKMTFPPT